MPEELTRWQKPSNVLYQHFGQTNRASEMNRGRTSCLLPRLNSFPPPKRGSCGGMNRWKLALPERERFGFVYAREPVRHRRGDAILTSRALLPLPLQHLGQRLATEVPPILVRKLANCEI